MDKRAKDIKRKKAEECKEEVLRVALELQKPEAIKIYHVADLYCLKESTLKQKLNLKKNSCGFYLFALSSEMDMAKVEQGLKKIKSGNAPKDEGKETPIMPVYIGQSGKLAGRFCRKHDAYIECVKYLETKGNDNYHIYLIVVELGDKLYDKAMALAIEMMMLANYDFVINQDNNQKKRSLSTAVDDFFASERMKQIKSPVVEITDNWMDDIKAVDNFLESMNIEEIKNSEPGTLGLANDIELARAMFANIPIKVASIFNNAEGLNGDPSRMSFQSPRKRKGKPDSADNGDISQSTQPPTKVNRSEQYENPGPSTSSQGNYQDQTAVLL